MMKQMRTVLFAVASMMVAGSCTETFNPNASSVERMIVFAVMRTETDTQFVRVSTTYSAMNDPRSMTTDTSVPDAHVAITDGTDTFLFRDSTLQRADTSRYRSRIGAHVAYGLRLAAGRQYRLSVFSPTRGTVTATATALYSPSFYPLPDLSGNISLRITLGQNARAYLPRAHLEYQVRTDTGWETRRIEIPRTVDETTGEFLYPKPVTRGVTSVLFSVTEFNAVHARLRQQFAARTVRLRRTLYTLTQFNDALYAYHSVANGFPDSGTLRLDEPDYTNITGGLGVFAMSSQTVVIADSSGG